MTDCVLVVEDVPEAQLLATAALEAAEFAVYSVTSGEDAIEAVRSRHVQPDCVLLDVVLPGIDGFTTCRRLRELSDAYILMLTSRADEADRVSGLEVGADDYLTKPYSTRELVARVHALLRRNRTPDQQPVRRFARLLIDPQAHRVVVDNREIEVTRREYALLMALTSAPDRVFTRSELLHAAWGTETTTGEHAIDVHLSNLRKKLQSGSEEHCVIDTVRGVGFRFRA